MSQMVAAFYLKLVDFKGLPLVCLERKYFTSDCIGVIAYLASEPVVLEDATIALQQGSPNAHSKVHLLHRRWTLSVHQ